MKCAGFMQEMHVSKCLRLPPLDTAYCVACRFDQAMAVLNSCVVCVAGCGLAGGEGGHLNHDGTIVEGSAAADCLPLSSISPTLVLCDARK